MTQSLDYITGKLDERVEKYLARDGTGQFIEELGYLRRTQSMWPSEMGGLAYWSCLYEDSNMSGGMVYFHYRFRDVDENLIDKFPEEGFYVNFEHVNDDLNNALEEFEEALKDVTKPDIEQGKDRSSKVIAGITAAVFLFDFIRVLYTQNCNGEVQSIFEFLHPVDQTNYKNLLFLEGLYTVGSTLKTIFY